jgi:hypothetical protein
VGMGGGEEIRGSEAQSEPCGSLAPKLADKAGLTEIRVGAF